MARKTENFTAYMERTLGADAELNAKYQRELARLKLANQIMTARGQKALAERAASPVGR